MSAQEHVQIVKDAFAAFGRGDMALFAEDIEWIIPGEWVLAGPHRGHAGLADFLQARETGLWSSAALRGESKLRTGPSRTILSSPLPFEMAK